MHRPPIRYNSHSMIIEFTSSSMRVMVANLSSRFWRTKAQVVMFTRGGIAVRSTR